MIMSLLRSVSLILHKCGICGNVLPSRSSSYQTPYMAEWCYSHRLIARTLLPGGAALSVQKIAGCPLAHPGRLPQAADGDDCSRLHECGIGAAAPSPSAGALLHFA